MTSLTVQGHRTMYAEYEWEEDTCFDTATYDNVNDCVWHVAHCRAPWSLYDPRTRSYVLKLTYDRDVITEAIIRHFAEVTE